MWFLYLLSGTAAAGSILSVVYLWAIGIISSVQLCVAAALAFGAALMFAIIMIIKLFKIKSPAPALLAVFMGCLAFTYFKWALYIANDAANNLSVSYIGWYHSYFVHDFVDENGELYNSAELFNIITEMRETSAYDYITEHGQEEAWGMDSWTADDLTEARETNFYSFAGYDVTLSPDSVNFAVNAAAESFNYSWYDYYEYYDEYGASPTAIYYMANPNVMYDTILKINTEGRWSYGANEIDVNGTLLWIVWIAEFLILLIFSIAAVPVGINSLNRPSKDILKSVKINPFDSSAAQGGQASWNSGGFGGDGESGADTADVDEFGRPLAQTDDYNLLSATNPIPNLSNTTDLENAEYEAVDELGRPIVQPDDRFLI